MTFLLNSLGTWNVLGTVTPNYGEWIFFPLPATQGFNTFRITFFGEWYSSSWNWIYIRDVYQTLGNKVVGKRWHKFYPKQEQEIASFYLMAEFGFQNLQRAFEVTKRHKYYGQNLIFNDKIFSVTLEEFSPYPELIAQLEQQTLSASTIEQIAQAVSQQQGNQLPPGLL